jgi:hypothetical protein
MKPKTERQWEAITRRAYNRANRDWHWRHLDDEAKIKRIAFAKFIAAEILKWPRQRPAKNSGIY